MPFQEPIAIIGSACRFAGSSTTPSKLWSLLRDPVSLQREIPTSRFNASAFYKSDGTHHGAMNVLHSYLLDQDPRVFDAEFFAINPLEARAMDPQQRMLLEVVYETLESAGLSMDKLKGSDTAVFAGLMCGDYEAMLLRDLDQAPTYFAVGTSRAVLSNRISYFFDWHGASVTVDTACSSSLVSVQQAVQALRNGDSHMAVACGSNLILGPEMYIIESKLKMLSPDGLSRMWDKDANGYARGEGVAAMALKTLSQALADGDNIQAIIREAGVNQDGATSGLTMPSASAQRELIHTVYRKAGLDPTKPEDQPQYIEAHGTGTPAGDPVEAEALSTAFFPSSHPVDQPIYAGSIKTVLGHTEGTAGIAALLKVVQAIKNCTIPPNLLFNELSPKVAPFYGNVRIPTKPLPWPPVPAGQPKRASVNNFGFGGTNAHAIVESYLDPRGDTGADVGQDRLFTPFVFSAASEQSLRANLTAYAEYLSQNPDTDVHALAYTLRDRRSQLAYRVALDASTLPDLVALINQRLSDTETPLGTRGMRKRDEPLKLLGVFTGQGAQYARMGSELVQQSPFAEGIIKSLDQILASLPEEDRPTWTLQAQILADESTSRVSEAAISQPLCTAIQILLVDILRIAGIHFSAVVGHSSGEIGAAYAAGYLSARDAILVAYYRGFHCKLAHSPNGSRKGAMMAVGTTFQDAMDICSEEEFVNRVGVAACNSESSVTISGDEDAIDEVAAILADEQKFHRRLRVDQAYHSAHMLPCSGPYIASLRRAGVEALPGNPDCTWFSSVFDGVPVDAAKHQLSDDYWTQNMVKPVLFSQALTAAVSSIAFDAAFEVGPHPSLAGPAAQVIDAALNKRIPYHGVLDRKRPATTALSAALGFYWSHLDGKSLALSTCETVLSGCPDLATRFRVLSDLPRYQWNHSVQHWAESRRSRQIRERADPPHELLGSRSPDSAAHVVRWHNVLKPNEMPWLVGHQVQKQIVLPAAAYVSTAIEAARSLCRAKTVQLIELSGFHIHNAIMFSNDGSGVEVQIELTTIAETEDSILARFTYSAATSGYSADLVLAADGQLEITLGEPSTTLLPPRPEAPPHMIPVEPERLYGFMQGLEYDFSGAFRSLTKMERKLGKAVCVGQKAATSVANADAVMLHPIDLDAAFQSAILAYSYPGDDQLRRLHLPTTIAKVTVNPAVLTCAAYAASETMALDSTCSGQNMASPGSGFSGSVALYAPGKDHAAVQVDQLQFLPVGSDASNDRDVFYKTHWLPARPNGHTAAAKIPITQADRDLMFVLSRIAAYYLRVFDGMVAEDDPARVESPLCHYLNYARHMTNLLKEGEHKWAFVDWLEDTEQDVLDYIDKYGYADNSDVRIMLLVGSVMPRVFKGETNMLQHFRESGLLDEYYSHGFGTRQCTMWVGAVLEQITNANPHLSILEVGAGTGGATKRILDTIGGDSVGSYTFTDISSSFFENAAEALGEWRDKLAFKVFNAEVDPVAQGFEAGTYDVVVAFMVVHACARLDEAVANLRRLLKPGGLLVLGEGASDGAMQAGAGFIFGTLPGWWRGVDEGRTLSPLVSADEWHTILRGAGFSGIDTMSPKSLFDAFGITLFVSTAEDDRVAFLREPLAAETALIRNKSLLKNGVVLLGGATEPVAKLARDICKTLGPVTDKITVFATLEEADNSALVDDRLVISLIDLEAPVFKDITPVRWAKFRKLWEQEGHLLWLSSGRLADEPYCNMTVGFARSAVHELDGLNVQFLDVPRIQDLTAKMVVEAALRWVTPELDGGNTTISPISYTKEPEVIFDEQGCELVPRLFTIKDANDRLNSTTRPVFRQVDTKNSVIELVQGVEGAHLRELSRYETCEALVPQPPPGETMDLRATHSVASAIRTLGGYQFLVVGADDQGKHYLTLSSTPRSRFKVPPASAAQIMDSQIKTESYIVLVAVELVALSIVDPLFAGQKLMVHNPSEVLCMPMRQRLFGKRIPINTLAAGYFP
ncbi:protein transport protein bet1 [Pyricularia grisea]|nr:protein transport protein bet1 [Pyricularia grisea]